MKPTQRLEIPRSERLVQALSKCIREWNTQIVVETGTFQGTGSTRIIIEAFGDRRPKAFHTIEISPSLVEQARKNLEPFPWVEVVWGFSVVREEAIAFVESDKMLQELDPSLDIFVDFLPDPRSGYLNEIRNGIGGGSTAGAPEGLLKMFLSRYRHDRPLISLDSAGGIGWHEFLQMREVMGGEPYLLFLDDINHIKHYRSKLAVESSPDFTVYDSDAEEGWMLAGHKAPAALSQNPPVSR